MKLNTYQKNCIECYNAQPGVSQVLIKIDDDNNWRMEGDKRRWVKFANAMFKQRKIAYDEFLKKVLSRFNAVEAVPELAAVGLAEIKQERLLTMAMPKISETKLKRLHALRNGTIEVLTGIESREDFCNISDENNLAETINMTHYGEVIETDGKTNKELAEEYIEKRPLYGQPVVTPEVFKLIQ